MSTKENFMNNFFAAVAKHSPTEKLVPSEHKLTPDQLTLVTGLLFSPVMAMKGKAVFDDEQAGLIVEELTQDIEKHGIALAVSRFVTTGGLTALAAGFEHAVDNGLFDVDMKTTIH